MPPNLLNRVVLAFYPEFVRRYYNLPNLLGVYVRGVPIEEVLFAATGGAVWSVAYEYVYGYRLERAGRSDTRGRALTPQAVRRIGHRYCP